MLSDYEVDPAKLAALNDESFEAPASIGVAEGWRAFKVKLELPAYNLPPKLESATYDFFWAPRQKARAVCEKSAACGDDLPGQHCTCGFYSAKTLAQLRKMPYPNYDLDTGYVSVVAKLANWGKVVEGSQGWRSEFAYPMLLFVPFEASHLAKPLVKAYGVPAALMNLLNPDADLSKARFIKP